MAAKAPAEAGTKASHSVLGGLGQQQSSQGTKSEGEKVMIYKRGKFYWYKFMWQGSLVRESTKQSNDKVARNMESAHRTSLAKGEVGIREKKAVPTLKEFLKQEFLPYIEMRHATKPNTLRYY